MLGCLAETRASGNSRKRWLWKTNQISEGYSFMLTILQNRFVYIKIYYPRCFIWIKWKRRVVCKISSDIRFFFQFCENTHSIFASVIMFAIFYFSAQNIWRDRWRDYFLSILPLWLVQYCILICFHTIL